MQPLNIIRKNTTVTMIEVFYDTSIVIDAQYIFIKRCINRSNPIRNAIIGITRTNEWNIALVHAVFC